MKNVGILHVNPEHSKNPDVYTYCYDRITTVKQLKKHYTHTHLHLTHIP